MDKDNSNIFNKYYVKKNENKIKELDIRNEAYNKKIKYIEQDINKNSDALERIKRENEEYRIKYEKLKYIFYERGLNITIVNKGYDVKEWDNLHLKNKSDLLSICLKDNEEVKVFNKDITIILEELLSNKNYSLVVTRVSERFIKVKLHIT